MIALVGIDMGALWDELQTSAPLVALNNSKCLTCSHVEGLLSNISKNLVKVNQKVSAFLVL